MSPFVLLTPLSPEAPKVPKSVIPAGVALVLALACGGDKTTGPSPDALAGTWNATKAEFVSVANPSVKVDLVAQGGTVRLVLTSSNAFTLTVTVPGEPVETHTGTWSASTDLLTLTRSAGGNWQFEMTLTDTTLALTGANMEFDVTGDGQDDPVTGNLTFAKQ